MNKRQKLTTQKAVCEGDGCEGEAQRPSSEPQDGHLPPRSFRAVHVKQAGCHGRTKLACWWQNPQHLLGPSLEVPPDSCEMAAVLEARPWQSWERAPMVGLSARLRVRKSGLYFFLFFFLFYFFFEHTIEYASRHRLGTLSGFPGSSLCQHFMISPSPSSGHRWHSPFLCISSKSGRSIKGGSVLITILDTKSSFMSPPRQYYLYFNTSEYSH